MQALGFAKAGAEKNACKNNSADQMSLYYESSFARPCFVAFVSA